MDKDAKSRLKAAAEEARAQNQPVPPERLLRAEATGDVCADCGAPLGLRNSVTMVWRGFYAPARTVGMGPFARAEPSHLEGRRVPICLLCCAGHEPSEPGW